MPLNWNVDKVVDWHMKDPNERDAMIWLLLAIGIGEITKKNVSQVYARIHAWEQLVGPMRQEKEEDTGVVHDLYTDYETVASWVGMHTNIGEMTKAKFKNKLMRILMDGYMGEKW